VSPPFVPLLSGSKRQAASLDVEDEQPTKRARKNVEDPAWPKKNVQISRATCDFWTERTRKGYAGPDKLQKQAICLKGELCKRYVCPISPCQFPAETTTHLRRHLEGGWHQGGERDELRCRKCRQPLGRQDSTTRHERRCTAAQQPAHGREETSSGDDKEGESVARNLV